MVSAPKILLPVLLLSLLCIGCKNTGSGNKDKEQNNSFKDTWYRHYTGAVAGRPVVVNLQCYGKNIEGSYYYADKGIVINLLPSVHNNGDMGNVAFIESNLAESIRDDDSTAPASWQLSIHDTVVKGKWTGGDGKSGDIELKEGYATGCYPLSVYVKGDSVLERKGAVHVTAASFFDLLQPSAQMNKEDAAFLQAAILHFLNGEAADVKNITDYIERENKDYFENFRKLLADMTINRETHEDWEYNFDHTRHLQALYNNNGMLVLQLGAADRTGGGMMGSHFRNRFIGIDVQEKKVWQLKNIMSVDAAKLSPLLNEVARTQFSLPAAGLLTGRLRVTEVPLTDNIYITGTGITFCYDPGIIAPEEDGEVCLFLPYTKLNKWLKEDYKKRMSL